MYIYNNKELTRLWVIDSVCLSGYLLKNYLTDFRHHSLIRKPDEHRCSIDLNIIKNVVFWFIKKKKQSVQ